MRWLPGDSTRFGPPRRWMRLRDYFSARPGSLRVALAEQALPPPRPALDSTMPQRFLASFRDSVPAAFVFTLHDARLLGAEGWVVAPGDIFLIDASFEGNVAAKAVRDHHIYRSRRGVALPLKQLKGRCLSLASDYAVGGFGHFVHDSITRLLLIEQAGFKLSDFDWIYVPHPRTAVPLGIISSLGVPRERILNYDPSSDFQCEELTATSFPGAPGYIAPVYAEFLRRRFTPVPTRRNRRVYLSRSGSRRNFSNLAEVETVQRRHGFEEVVPHKDAETLQKCAEAEFVFCLEGAGFFNSISCAAGTRVLIVFPDRLPHVVPYALTFAEAARFRTLAMGGKSADAPGIEGGEADVYLDPDLLEAALQRMEEA